MSRSAMQSVEVTSLTPQLLRSRTPEIGDKMALYFESMRHEAPQPLEEDEVARSEASHPRSSYHPTHDPRYAMLPPEMRREDSNVRLEREVFGENGGYGGSDYLRGVQSSGGRNGTGNPGGGTTGRSRRESRSTYAEEPNGVGLQGMREDVRSGWGDDRSRQGLPPQQQNSHHAPSGYARSRAHTAAGFALPGSNNSFSSAEHPSAPPADARSQRSRAPTHQTHERKDSGSSGPLPTGDWVTDPDARRTPAHAVEVESVTDPDGPSRPPVQSPRERERIISQSSGPSFGNIHPQRESSQAGAAYKPLSTYALSVAPQDVHITIQAPTDSNLSRGVTPIQLYPNPAAAPSQRAESRASVRTAGTHKSVRQEGEEWARRERQLEEERRLEAEREAEEERRAAERERVSRLREMSPTATHRTQQTTRSILKQPPSVHPSAMPLPMSGRTTPTRATAPPLRAEQYGGRDYMSQGGYGPGPTRSEAEYARGNSEDYMREREEEEYMTQSPEERYGPSHGYGGPASQRAPSNYGGAPASNYGPPQSQRAPSMYDPTHGGPPSNYGGPSPRAVNQPLPPSQYAPSQFTRSPPPAQAPISPMVDPAPAPVAAQAIHIGVGGNDIQLTTGKDGQTVITVHTATPAAPPPQQELPPPPPQQLERAPSRHSRAPSPQPPPPPQEAPLSPRAPSLAATQQSRAPLPKSHTPRTSYTMTPSQLAEQVSTSHFHDDDLCVLLKTADDDRVPDVVRRAVRRAVVKRMRKLGMEVNEDLLRSPKTTSQKSSRMMRSAREREARSPPPAIISPVPVPVYVNMPKDDSMTPPPWAQPLFDMLHRAQSRLDTLDMRLESSRQNSQESIPDEGIEDEYDPRIQEIEDEEEGRAHSDAETERPPPPPQPQPDDILIRVGDKDITIHQRAPAPPTRESTPPEQDRESEDPLAETRAALHKILHPSEDGEMEEELYKLRQKPVDRSDAVSHRTWEIERDDGDRRTETLPDLPPSERGHYRKESPPLPPLPAEALDYDHDTQAHGDQPSTAWPPQGWPSNDSAPAPWQRVHQRLLNWAIVWPMSELDNALLSTSRGHQVDEIALSIWTAQVYKRYVRARMTDNPPNRVDRLFVPPNMADAINNAVFNGRHGDACGMLRDLWTPFGLEGMPRLLVVLARHRRDENHWVVHRFSLPDGNLTTYDTYPERALPDGRPLGWWFAIRIAWPHAMYPHPDHLVQKMVRLHRPLQLLVDNSVAAAAIWRNILMGSKPERQVDLERLRDLVSSEVKSLRSRKDMGRLSISTGKTGWEDLA